MAAACVGRWLLQASNVISRQPVPSKIGGELPGTAATLLRTRCVTSAKQFSTSTVCHHQDDSTPEKALFRPRRTLMYVPASDERKTKKAASLRVDTIVFDLEDGVALNQKVCLNPKTTPQLSQVPYATREESIGTWQSKIISRNVCDWDQ